MITVYRLYLFTGKATGIENVDSIGFVPLQKERKNPTSLLSEKWGLYVHLMATPDKS